MVDRSSTIVSAATSEREKAIEQALTQIERRFGKGAIMKLGDVSKIHVEVIPTGSIAASVPPATWVYSKRAASTSRCSTRMTFGCPTV